VKRLNLHGVSKNVIRGYNREAESPIDLMVEVKLISSYTLCPFRVFLIKYLGLKEDVEYLTAKGRVLHQLYYELTLAKLRALEMGLDEESLLKSISHRYLSSVLTEREVETVVDFRVSTPLIGTPVEVERLFKSRELAMIGRVDLIEGGVPIEVKSRDRVLESDRIQLALYALLIERERKVNIDTGCIDLPLIARREFVTLTDSLRRKALELRDLTIEISLTPSPPPRRRSESRCKYCGLEEVCRTLIV